MLPSLAILLYSVPLLKKSLGRYPLSPIPSTIDQVPAGPSSPYCAYKPKSANVTSNSPVVALALTLKVSVQYAYPVPARINDSARTPLMIDFFPILLISNNLHIFCFF